MAKVKAFLQGGAFDKHKWHEGMTCAGMCTQVAAIIQAAMSRDGLDAPIMEVSGI